MRKRRSPLIDVRLQTDETTRLLLQEVTVRRLSLYRKEVASFKTLKLHRSVKEMDGAILCRVGVEQSILEACGVETLLIDDTCTRLSVTPQVGFKA